jgi:hypothetical protein
MVKTKKKLQKIGGPQNLEALKFPENLEALCRRTFGTCALAAPAFKQIRLGFYLFEILNIGITWGEFKCFPREFIVFVYISYLLSAPMFRLT